VGAAPSAALSLVDVPAGVEGPFRRTRAVLAPGIVDVELAERHVGNARPKMLLQRFKCNRPIRRAQHLPSQLSTLCGSQGNPGKLRPPRERSSAILVGGLNQVPPVEVETKRL
jgi:hypothetical protein